MTPTKEQLADPKWWDENAPGDEFNFFLVDADGAIRPCFNRIERGKYIDSYGIPWCAVDEEADAGAIAYSRPPRWTGEGLPPVGTNVEIAGDDLIYGGGESGEVIAHVENTAVVRMSYGLGCFDARVLRPIRTPEQIAAEEREKAIQQMIEDADYGGQRIREIFSRLYDAGYRKQEQPK